MKHLLARHVAIAAVTLISATGVAAAASGTNPLGPERGSGRLGSPSALVSDDEPNDPPPPSTTSTSTTTTTPDTSTTSTTSTSTTTTSTTSTTTTSIPAADDGSDEECAEGTHGARVSAVARDKSNDGDRNHGAVVSEAAHDKTGCGNEPSIEDDATEPESQKSGPSAKSGRKATRKKG